MECYLIKQTVVDEYKSEAKKVSQVLLERSFLLPSVTQRLSLLCRLLRLDQLGVFAPCDN